MSALEPGRSDPRALLELLVESGVDFILIGGFAVAVHGVVRATSDLDICPGPFERNLGRLGTLLEEISHSPPTVEQLRGGGNLELETSFGPLKLMQILAPFGTRAYTVLDRHAESHRLGRFEVRVTGYDELLEMKLAAGREQDLIDVGALKAARREL